MYVKIRKLSHLRIKINPRSAMQNSQMTYTRYFFELYSSRSKFLSNTGDDTQTKQMLQIHEFGKNSSQSVLQPGAYFTTWFNFLAWISNHMHYNVCDEIIYPFPNPNGCTAVWICESFGYANPCSAMYSWHSHIEYGNIRGVHGVVWFRKIPYADMLAIVCVKRLDNGFLCVRLTYVNITRGKDLF